MQSEIDLLVVDDNFPVKESAFRYEEFTKILQNINNSMVLSTFESIRYSGKKSRKALLQSVNSEISNCILTKLPQNVNKCKMLYGLFLYNTYNYILPIAEKYKIPFAFTLYPGGRFSLNDSKSDLQLKRIFASKYFKKVIVTQRVTYNYLIDNNLCGRDKIAYIFGGILREQDLNRKIDHNIQKNKLNICFTAFKYSKFGEDKGYDVFIKIVERYKNNSNINFHVVGNFDEKVIPIEKVENLKFYGIKEPEWFYDFYKNIDMIISPNIPGKINNGSFDGFPTSCVLEAGLNEVAMFCTDDLKQNDNHFKDGRDIIIIKHDVEEICAKIDYYSKHKEELIDLGKNGRAKIQEVYGYNSQIKPRINIINEIMKSNKENFTKTKRFFEFKMNLVIKIKYITNKLYGIIKGK